MVLGYEYQLWWIYDPLVSISGQWELFSLDTFDKEALNEPAELSSVYLGDNFITVLSLDYVSY